MTSIPAAFVCVPLGAFAYISPGVSTICSPFLDESWLLAQPWEILQLRPSSLCHQQVRSDLHPQVRMGDDRDGDDESQPLHRQTAACSSPFAADGGEYFHSRRGRRASRCRNGRIATCLHQAHQIRHRAWKVFNSPTSIEISRCQGNSFLQALIYPGLIQVAQPSPVSPRLTSVLQE